MFSNRSGRLRWCGRFEDRHHNEFAMILFCEGGEGGVGARLDEAIAENA